jgi:hypothetical protein
MFLNLVKTAYARSSLTGVSVDTNTFIQRILDNIVNPLILLMLAVAIVVFLWGVFQFVRNAESSDERKKGGMHILWGSVGLFIMVTAYGILNLILGTIR